MLPKPVSSVNNMTPFSPRTCSRQPSDLGQLLPGMLRQVPLQIENANAPVPRSLAFYSTDKCKRVPTATKELSEQLYQRAGSELCTMTVASGRFGMCGSCAAAANNATEAWVVGPTQTLQHRESDTC